MTAATLKAFVLITACAAILAGTGARAETETSVAVAELPPGVTSAVQAAIPGMTLTGATRKDRDERIYYDVEGLRPDGTVVELDLLAEKDGFRVVEIQRDLKWNEVPASVREAALAAKAGTEPVRVIESKEDDGSVIYELFAAGKPEKPSLEVRVASGKVTVLAEAWPH
jgi:hypothetical protein